MATPTHGTDDAHHPAGPHPELPPVQDEAADTPLWLPVTGLVLLAIFALFVLWRGARSEGEIPLDEMPAAVPEIDLDGEAPAAE